MGKKGLRIGHLKWNAVAGLLLYSALASANKIPSLPSPAVETCRDYLHHDQIEAFFYKPGMRIEVDGKPKDIFLEKGPWGKPVLIMRIQDEQEAWKITEALVLGMNASMHSSYSLTKSSHGIEVKDLLASDITRLGEAFLLPSDQGSKGLSISLDPNNKNPQMMPAFFSTMSTVFRIHQKAHACATCFEFDLSTQEGRRNWGLAGFYFWNKNLSEGARAGMNLISGPSYRHYLPYLRGEKAPSKNERESEMISYLHELNDAILKDGRIPQRVTLYRAVKGQKFEDIWKKLSAGKGEESVSDSAFAFTSLDENFVEGWLRNELRGDGIILEIHAPAGLPAGYVDRGQYKDYAEIVLPMHARVFATRAFTDSEGRKRLHVEYRK